LLSSTAGLAFKLLCPELCGLLCGRARCIFPGKEDRIKHSQLTWDALALIQATTITTSCPTVLATFLFLNGTTGNFYLPESAST
jgi:hypothetical protein